jgi:hypothetical protein
MLIETTKGMSRPCENLCTKGEQEIMWIAKMRVRYLSASRATEQLIQKGQEGERGKGIRGKGGSIQENLAHTGVG